MSLNSSPTSATKRPRKGSPIVVENASGKITIYATGTDYTLAWTAGGERRREKRRTLDDAHDRARKILADLRAGSGHLRSFTIQQTASDDDILEVDIAAPGRSEVPVALRVAIVETDFDSVVPGRRDPRDKSLPGRGARYPKRGQKERSLMAVG